MCDEFNIACNTIVRRGCVFNFLSLLTCRFFLVGLSRKLKEKFLRDLCDSSEEGGKSMSKRLRRKRTNPNAPRKGAKIKGEPIRSLKDIQVPCIVL